MKTHLLILGFFLVTSSCFSQKEAYNWFFGNKAAMRFHTGSPAPFGGSQMITRKGSISMSNKMGSLMFYSNGETVWNVGHQPMPNGSGLYGSGLSSQPGISFEVPNNPNKYYLFTTGNELNPGCYYSIIDMSLNAGLGDVVADKKNIFIPGTEMAEGVVMAIKHANHRDYWVVFRTLTTPNMLLSYLVTEEGISSTPNMTQTLKSHAPGVEYSLSKFSPDGRFYCYSTADWYQEEPRIFELYTFNDATGFLTPLFTFIGIGDDMEHRGNGMEFSADGAFLYLSLIGIEPGEPPTVRQAIVQYKMHRIGSQDAFENGRTIVYNEDIIDGYCYLQLGPDGRIYVAQNAGKNKQYLSRIMFPYKEGTECLFQQDVVYLAPRESDFGLPVFMPSYLTRFDWTGNCFPDTTRFYAKFLPNVNTIIWDFDDPDSGQNTATGQNPVHVFSKPGTFNVTASAHHNGEEIEVYSRKVTIVPFPSFSLGPDFPVCTGAEVELTPGLVQGIYTWSTGDTTTSITVPTPGDYWCSIENRYGCVTTDTIHLTNFAIPTLDETNVNILPTTCTGETGEISGLVVNGDPPIQYEWKDESGGIVCTTLNAEDLGVGTYSLSVQYGDGCTVFMGEYDVETVGNNLIQNATSTPAYCGFPTGTINITAINGFSDKLQYSINGSPWQASGSFQDLSAGDYVVRARVIENQTCIGDFIDNPLNVPAFEKPVIDSVTSQPALDNNADGSITIYASGVGFSYTLEGGPPQSSPTFNNLPSGTYTYTVTDPNGCTFDSTATVLQINSVYLNALVGNDAVCNGDIASVPVKIYNFTGLKAFRLVIDYNPSGILCQPNFINPHPSLASNIQMDVSQSGKIILTWSAAASLTLNDTITLLELVFNTSEPGAVPIVWDEATIESWFTSDPLLRIVPDYTLGQVLVYNLPVVTLSDASVCEGSPKTINASVSPPGTYDFKWKLPDGTIQTSPQLNITSVTSATSGQYELVVTDISGCADQSSMSLSVLPLPLDPFPLDTILFLNEYLLSIESNYQSYQWNTGETSPSIVVTEEGEYSVVLTDSYYCSKDYSVMLVEDYERSMEFYMPDAFTPNGDNLNEAFRPVTGYDQLSKFSLSIFSRGGQLLFQTNNAQTGWDGLVNGMEATTGIYIYEVVYSNDQNANVRLKGKVTLLR
jgi:gliding motility-associated-like protein